MNVLIIDDEPLAVKLLETYVKKVPDCTLVGKCSNALEAFDILNRQNVDVMFLDINMPGITGMDFVKMLKDPPCIIFTTAYTNYAVESYNYNVVDYLVKPITFERFMKAVHKLTNTFSVSLQSDEDRNMLFVRSEGKLVKVNLKELHFIEGCKNYVLLSVNGKKIIVHNTMKNLEEYLSVHPEFIRVHKSFIVNADHISEIIGNTIKVAKDVIGIGTMYKENVHAALKKYKQL